MYGQNNEYQTRTPIIRTQNHQDIQEANSHGAFFYGNKYVKVWGVVRREYYDDSLGNVISVEKIAKISGKGIEKHLKGVAQCMTSTGLVDTVELEEVDEAA